MVKIAYPMHDFAKRFGELTNVVELSRPPKPVRPGFRQAEIYRDREALLDVGEVGRQRMQQCMMGWCHRSAIRTPDF
jgi:hypothetical protein